MSGTQAGVASGVKWTLVSNFTSGLLQIVLLAVMARLVSPEDFGTLAAALLVLKALQVLIQSGYERAVIWVETPDMACLSGLFWMSVLTGLLITATIVFLSGPIALFFSAPRLNGALVTMAPMAVLAAPGLVPRGLLRRHMRFKELALYELTSYVVAFAGVGLPMALTGFGLWALVAANLLQCLLQGALPLYLAPPPIFSRFGWRDIRVPLRFGFSVSGLGIIEFIDTQATQIFVGRAFGMGSLGAFNRSYAMIQLPLEQTGTALSRVLFSPFNRERGNPERLRHVTVEPLRLLAIVVLPVALGGGAVSRTVTEAMLGSGWAEAGPIFSALCIGTAAAVLGNVLATMNEALNLIRQKTVAQVLVTSLLIVLLACFGRQGVVAAAGCFSFTRVLFLCAQIWLAAPHLGLSRGHLAKSLLPALGLGLAVGAVLFLADLMLRNAGVDPWGRLGLLTAVGMFCLVVGAWFALPELREKLFRFTKAAHV